MNARPIIHSMWIGNRLSAMELLTLHSFHANGHEFNLWLYDMSLPVPSFVKKTDARSIIPEREIFYYKKTSKTGLGKGSLAGFSDIFRFKLLHMHGGIWVDMDITCLRPLDFESEHFFRYHHILGAVANVMKSPAESPIMQWCHEQAVARVKEDNRQWVLPIKILNEGIRKFGLDKHIGRISNNDSWPKVAEMLQSPEEPPTDWKVIHWMNEEFRHLSLNKDKAIIGSLYDRLLQKYQILHQPFEAVDHWRLSGIRRLLVILKGQVDWALAR